MTVLSWVLLAVPAIFVWSRGRKILPQKGEAAFEELHFQKARHGGLALGIVVGVVLFNDPSYLLLKLGFLLLSMAVADYPYRKQLFGFSQGLVPYLWFSLRLALGLHGHVIFLALIPAVAACCEELAATFGASGWALPSAVAMAVLTLLAMHGTPWRFKLLVRAPSLPAAQLDALGLGILERARCRVPEMRHFGPKGGFYFNAHALTSFYRPLVLLSDDLLATLGPGESRAIVANSVAHLEMATPRRRFGYELGFLLLVVVGLVATLAAAQASLGALTFVGWIWPMVLLLGRGWLATSSQRRQHRSDLRGVELSGDAQVWADAVNKVHAFNYLPRRWTGDDGELSHPSLANRLRVVQEAQMSETPPPLPGAAPPKVLDELVVRGVSDRGTVVVLTGDRLHWLEGVSLHAGADPQAAYDLAKVRRTATYRELIDLRLQAERGGHFWLEAKAIDGHRRVRLAANDVAAVKQRLDVIDQQLLGTASDRAPVASEDRSKSFSLRLNGFLMALLALFQPLTSVVSLSGLMVLALPSRTALALAGTLALISQGVALLRGEGLMALAGDLEIGGPLLNAVCMLLLGMLFLNAAARRYRLRTTEPAWSLWLPLVVLAPVAILSAVLGAMRWGLPFPRWQLHLWARDVPLVVPILLASAVALCLLRRLSSRLLAGACLTVASLVMLVGSPLARQMFVDEPLAQRGPAFDLEPSPLQLHAGHELDVDAWVGLVRWSSSGQRLAAQSEMSGYDDEGWGYDYDDEEETTEASIPSHGTGSGDDGSSATAGQALGATTVTESTFWVELGNGGTMAVAADDLVFIDDHRLLLLDRSGEAPRLRTLSLHPTSEAAVEIRLPPLMATSFDWLESEGQWQVSGFAADAEATLVRYRGDLAAMPQEDLRFQLPPDDDNSYVNWTLGPRSALLVLEDIGGDDFGWGLFLQGLMGSSGSRQLSLMTAADPAGEPRHLVTTSLSCHCLEPPPSISDGICLLGDGTDTALWTVDMNSGELQVLGHVEGGFLEAAHLPSGVVLRLDEQRFLQLDPLVGTGRRLEARSADQGSELDGDVDGQSAADDQASGFWAQLLTDQLEGFWTSSLLTLDGGRLALTESSGEQTRIRLFDLPAEVEGE